MLAASNDATLSTGCVTEIVVANNNVNVETVVYPMLAHLSQQCKDKWFTWISDNTAAEKTTLSAFAFDRSKVRLVDCNSKHDALCLFWDALIQGNSDTVVAKFTHLSDTDRAFLDEAASQGNTKGIILVQREH